MSNWLKFYYYMFALLMVVNLCMFIFYGSIVSFIVVIFQAAVLVFDVYKMKEDNNAN